MGKIVQFERYSSFDSINRVYLDGRFSSVNLIINLHDPEKQITNLNQILHKMLIWRTQDGIILMKDYILDQPISVVDQIKQLIGEDTLENMLDDITASAQDIVQDVYSENATSTYSKPIQYVSGGDPTSIQRCVIWVEKPGSNKAYAVNVNFTFEELETVETAKYTRTGKTY